MTFYTKLKKQKRLNRGFSSSFTVLELVIVLIIIGILAYVANFSFFNTSLQVAADNIIKDIRYTQSLALKEDKYQPYPAHACDGSDEGKIECNRSKYWFKQWWHLRITNAGNDIIYYVFSDQPRSSSSTNFDLKTVTASQYTVELAKNPYNNKYLIGANKEDTGNNNYPPKSEIDKNLNLTKTFGIKRVEINQSFSSSSMPGNLGKRVDLLFDNFGNVFFKEGDAGDAGDINPLDKEKRKILIGLAAIKLCTTTDCSLKDIDHCIQINITPAGYIYKSNCE